MRKIKRRKDPMPIKSHDAPEPAERSPVHLVPKDGGSFALDETTLVGHYINGLFVPLSKEGGE